MHSKIQRWGNSLGVRIPKPIAEKLNLHSGSKVELNADHKHITISRFQSELDYLLDQINNSNCHNEKFNTDQKLGNESW